MRYGILCAPFKIEPRAVVEMRRGIQRIPPERTIEKLFDLFFILSGGCHPLQNCARCLCASAEEHEKREGQSRSGRGTRESLREFENLRFSPFFANRKF